MKEKYIIALWIIGIVALCLGMVLLIVSDSKKRAEEREARQHSIREVPVMYCVSACVQSMTRHETTQLLGGASAAVVGTEDVVSYCRQVYTEGCYIGGVDAVLELHPSDNNLSYYEYMGVKKLEKRHEER